MKPPRFPWTEERIAELRKHFAGGLTHAQIAMAIDPTGTLSRNAVIGKCSRLGFARHYVPPGRTKAQVHRDNSTAMKFYHAAKKSAPLSLKPRGMEQANEAADLAADVSPCAVSLLELRPEHCRWPLGDSRDPDMKYCGAGTIDDASYCARHFRISYIGIPARKISKPWR